METPAAAVIADLLAKEADFFSIAPMTSLDIQWLQTEETLMLLTYILHIIRQCLGT